MAMLGIRTAAPAPAPVPEPAPVPAPAPEAPPLPSALSSAPRTTAVNSSPALAPAPPVSAPAAAATDDEGSDLTSTQAIQAASTALRAQPLASHLSKREFIREFLSLIHTDDEFAERLYQAYISR